MVCLSCLSSVTLPSALAHLRLRRKSVRRLPNAPRDAYRFPIGGQSHPRSWVRSPSPLPASRSFRMRSKSIPNRPWSPAPDLRGGCYCESRVLPIRSECCWSKASHPPFLSSYSSRLAELVGVKLRFSESAQANVGRRRFDATITRVEIWKPPFSSSLAKP